MTFFTHQGKQYLPMKNLLPDTPPALLGLRSIRLLAGLPDDVLADIAQVAQFRRYRRGQTLVHREDPERDLCLISAGHVRVIMLSPSGREVRFRDIPAGDAFDEIAARDGLVLRDRDRLCVIDVCRLSDRLEGWPMAA